MMGRISLDMWDVLDRWQGRVHISGFTSPLREFRCADQNNRKRYTKGCSEKIGDD